jgi:hypothetical protein
VTELLDDDLAELLDELEARSTPSIGPGAESVSVELYAPTTVDSRWDRALWNAQTWDAPSWEAVECQVVEADYQSGVSQEAGILSVPDAGALDLRTYDPDRLLDPLATESPFFGSVRPGTPIRIRGRVPGPVGAWTGYIDEARFELATYTGRIRAVDGIAYLAQAEVPEGTVLPNTLRARVRAVVAAVGLGATVPVQGELVSTQRLTNPSFEPDAAGWTNQGGGAGSGSVAVSGAPDGARALKVVGGGGYPQFEQLVPSLAGLTYTCSVWTMRTAGLPGSLIPVAKDAAGTLLLAGQVDGTFSGGTWEYLSTSLTTPEGTAFVGLDLRIHAAATAATDAPLFDLAQLVGPDPGATLPPDPPVAAFDGKAASAWSVIQDAALDALTFVWLDGTGTLRFTPWGSLPDADYSLGCDDGTGGAWLVGVSSLEAVAQADGIRNAVRTWSSANTFGAAVKDPGSINRYGERRLDVARIVPNAATWASRILADRADAGLEVTVGELRPYTESELALLLNGALAGPSVIRFRDDAHGELVDLDIALLGRAVGITAGGWRFRQVAMIPRAEWDQTEPPPITPPIPPPDPWHTETRTYIATSDALIALTSGGSKYGAGASSSLPVGVWSGWTYRALIAFPAIPWTKVRRIVSATLDLATSSQVRVGFGSSPTIEAKRITSSWSAGSSSSPSSGNAVVWPGPSTTGSIRSNVTGAENATVRIRVDGLVLPWAPTSVGGILAPQYGLALYPGSGSTADTTEFQPVEASGSASDPTLELVLEVFD